jgi:hypothetical protein
MSTNDQRTNVVKKVAKSFGFLNVLACIILGVCVVIALLH